MTLKYALKMQLRLLTRDGFFSETGSDTFRNVLIYGKEKEYQKKYVITVQNNIHFLRFDHRNKFF